MDRPDSIAKWIESWQSGVPQEAKYKKPNEKTSIPKREPNRKAQPEPSAKSKPVRPESKPATDSGPASNAKPMKPESKSSDGKKTVAKRLPLGFGDRAVDFLYSTIVFFIIYGLIWSLARWVIEKLMEDIFHQDTNIYIIIGVAIIAVMSSFSCLKKGSKGEFIERNPSLYSSMDSATVNNYRHSFMDYIDTLFEFFTGLVLVIIMYLIMFAIVGWIIESNTLLSIDKDITRMVIVSSGLLALWRAIPEERRKNKLLAKDKRYAEFYGFFGIMFFIVIAAAIIGAIFDWFK